MTEYVANRRLYKGRGEFYEQGEPFSNVDQQSTDRLFATGAVSIVKPADKASPKSGKAPSKAAK